MTNPHVQDLFEWAQELERTGDSRDADLAMSKVQLQRHYAGALRAVIATLQIAKEQPAILDAAIEMLERVLEL